MTAHDIIACALVGLLIASVSGVYCFSRGRAYGWYEGYHERERAERERRNKLGQFRKVIP